MEPLKFRAPSYTLEWYEFIVASNSAYTRYAANSMAHEDASPIAARVNAAPMAGQDGDAGTAGADDERACRRPGQQPADREPGHRDPRLGVGQPERVLDRRQRGKTAAAIAP